MGKEKLSNEELQTRIAVLKRFKSLLQEQREKFCQYLFVLERQEQEIEKSNVEAIVQHNEIENNIIENIVSVQKVIEPIEKMYYIINPAASDGDVAKLKDDLGRLQVAVLKQNEKNQVMLQEKMGALNQEIAQFSFKTPYKKSVYAKDEDVANYVDVSY